MVDPREGMAPDLTISTGAARHRVPAAFESVVGRSVTALGGAGSLHLYGSVAVGTATVEMSDVDLLGVGLPAGMARAAAHELSAEFTAVCRGVELAHLDPADLAGEGDAAYGNRVFLRHYCVLLIGPDIAADWPAFPADARAARGFNDDVGRHLDRWREDLDRGASAADLGRRVARKSLLALAGVVSVHDATWTTDRRRAAAHWGEVEGGLRSDLDRLVGWADGERAASSDEVRSALDDDGVVALVVRRFVDTVGLWAPAPPPHDRQTR